MVIQMLIVSLSQIMVGEREIVSQQPTLETLERRQVGKSTDRKRKWFLWEYLRRLWPATHYYTSLASPQPRKKSIMERSGGLGVGRGLSNRKKNLAFFL